MSAASWTSWLGIVAVVLGMLATAEHGTELTRHAVITHATPAGGELPPAACPADELEEENLTAAECRQMVSNVRNFTLSSPAWFSVVGMTLASLGVLLSLGSVVAGASLLQGRAWAGAVAAAVFAALAAVDGARFVAVLNAGPILRDLYLWNTLLWFTLHLTMMVAAVAGRSADAAGASAPAAAGRDDTAAQPHRPFRRSAAWCHALIAISVFFLFASSWWMLALPLPSEDFVYRAFPFQLHKNLGITLMLLLGLMLYVRFRRPPSPPASRRLPRSMHRLAVADHVALYALITLVSISGYMSSSYSGWSTTLWWLVDLPHWGYEDEALNIFWSDVHLWSCWALLAFLAAHVGGALYHAFRSDGFVRRMLRP